MNDDFDVYYRWLGIPPAEQPANYYRLLGLSLFEPNEEVIRIAAEQRQTFLRTFQQGHGAERSQHLLNEITQAKLCLLDSRRRADYDAGLKLAARSPQLPPSGNAMASPSASATLANDPAPAAATFNPDDFSSATPQSSLLTTGLFWSVSVASALAVVSFVVVAAIVAITWWTQTPVTVAANSAPAADDGGLPLGPKSSGADSPATTDNGQPETQSQGPMPPSAVDPSESSPGEIENDDEPPEIPTEQPNRPTPPPTELSDPLNPDPLNPDPEDPSALAGTDPEATVSETPDASDPSSDPPSAPQSIQVTPSELASARETVRQIYAWDPAAEMGERLQAYDRLLMLAQDDKQSPASQLAAYCEARLVAWTLVDLDLLNRTTADIVAGFEVDLADVDREGCLLALDHATTNEAFSKLWWLAQDTTGRLLLQDQTAQALEIWETFEKAARAEAGKPYRRWVTDQRRELDQWTTQRTEIPGERLTDLDPANLSPPQNLAVGQWLAAVRNHWTASLPFLAAGDNDLIRSAASEELAAANRSPQVLRQLAEAWLAASASLEPHQQGWAQRRAVLLLQEIDTSQLEVSLQEQLKQQIVDLKAKLSAAPDSDMGRSFASRYVSRVDLIDQGVLWQAPSPVTALALAGNENLLGIGTDDGQLQLFDLGARNPTAEIAVGSGIASLSWYPDASRLVIATSSGTLKTWEIRRTSAEETASELSAQITQVAVGPKGRTVVGASRDGTLFFWNGSNGRLLTAVRDHRREITTLSVSEDGRVMITGAEDQKAQLWNEQGPLARLNGHVDTVSASTLSYDGLYAATADKRGNVYVWSTTDGQQLASLPRLSNDEIIGLCFVQQWPRLIALTDDAHLAVFDLITQTWTAKLALPITSPTTMAHDPRGNRIVIGNRAGDVQLIEVTGVLSGQTPSLANDSAP